MVELKPVSIPLLITKLAIPAPPPDLVPRKRLIDRLNEGIGRKLTLVSAPAGYGKTTLLSTWCTSLSDRDHPVAWVSLDDGDNDPARFVRYLVAAIESAQLGKEPDVASLSRPLDGTQVELVLAALINRLASAPIMVSVILDDYHLIGAESVHNVLSYLLEHIPPQMQLVVAGRSDPPLRVARFRSRGQLVELSASDLAFTAEEASDLLCGVLGPEAPPIDAADLQARTEGWAAGLQMAALSAKGGADLSQLATGFSRTRPLFEYLAEQVLDLQEQDVQSFLLQTCVLERLHGPLCDAVTGRENGQEMLERLERANLFVRPLDGERRWYGYHRLFYDFLRERLRRTGGAQISELHRRASGWHERNGTMEQAVHNALASENSESAARIISQAYDDVFAGGEV